MYVLFDTESMFEVFSTKDNPSEVLKKYFEIMTFIYILIEKILKTIERKTGLTATCGIGPNLLLAKVAMDTEAKKYKNGIAKWTYEDIPEKLKEELK